MKLFGLNITRSQSNQGYNDALPTIARRAGNENIFRPMSWNEMLENTTVASCVMLISDAIGLLSCHVYRRTEHGRERDDRPSLSYLLHSAPNYFDTPFSFFQTLALHLLLKGNGFLCIERNSDFSVKSLTPLDPDSVYIRFDDKGELYYEFRNSADHRVYKYDRFHILHIPAYRYNTIRGMAPMEYANQAARLGLNLDEYTNNSFDGGINSKLMITVPVEEKNWTREDSQKLTERILEAYGGLDNQNKPFILSKGLKGDALNLASNADNQLTENRTFSEKEVAKIYRVPLFMLGKDDAKFTNNEQANTFFLQHTLTPWLVRIQQYFNRLLTYPYRMDHYVEFDTDTMLRADYKSRLETEIKSMQAGIYTLNQVLDLENLPRVKEKFADQHFMPVNLSTMDKIANQPLASAKDNAKEIKKD